MSYMATYCLNIQIADAHWETPVCFQLELPANSTFTSIED